MFAGRVSPVSQLHPIFFDEASENLDAMEQALLRFDPLTSDHEQLDAIFRAAHSVKGGAAAFGYANVAEFVHLMESLLQRLRNRDLRPDVLLVDLLLESVDVTRALLAWHQGGAVASAQPPEVLVQRLRAVVVDALPSHAARTLTIRIGPAARAEDLQAVVALFRDIPGLGTAVELPAEGGNIHSFAVLTDAPDEELMALLSFHVAADLVSIQTAASTPVAGAGGRNLVPAGTDMGHGVPATPSVAPLLHKHAESTTIRVARDEVEHLVWLAAEFAHTQTLLEQSRHALDPLIHAQLLAGLTQLGRNSDDLRESVLALRMMPMVTVFSRFPRMLRDLSRKLGKKFALIVQGEDMELDKSIVEKITDPLMHLVRNSCGHGIETPTERRAAGKPDAGTITLSVTSGQGSVTIEVRDDGRGLSREKILKAARERGLSVSTYIADGELWQLVFAAGFSTAEAVTEVSGRGVGMDVVKRNVAALGGEVAIAWTGGQGTCVSIRLPVG
jgi:two-component system chemotaxis sensor kinase CheA